ncbi:ComEA family DNA-binding protein [Halalkalibaculum sp. DA384]|uniref:ComEA family DNA-binding protein n=1 Tax=Halalkalibaculum sp. DA384 TaxID=3373606 RepID=UPI003753FDCA
MLKKLLIAVAVISAGTSSFAQQPDTTDSEVRDDLERALENIDPEDTDLNAEQLTRFLQNLAANPIDINTAGIDDLLQVPGLNLRLARAVLDYRNDVKPFESVDELREVPGIGRVTLDRVRPYVTIETGPGLRALYTDPRYWTSDSEVEFFSRFQRSLQEQEGYRRPDSTGFQGSPVKYYHRLQYSSNHISANLTQEKDAGEPLKGLSGFDYTSWHLALTDNGKLQQMVIGDYSLSFGQGLVLWNGGAFGKGREVIGTVAKKERGIHPYTSSMEANFFRGIAATYGGQFRVTGFYSAQRRSASVINEDTTRFPSDDGMHRTRTEIAKKGSLKQNMAGGRVRLALPFGIIGATGYHTSFNKQIYPGSAVYNAFDFRGRQTSALGVDYKLLLGSTLIFGEGARTKNSGMGLITGIETPIRNNTGLVIAYRNYQKNFQSVYGAGFGEQSGEPQNEEGIYIGLSHELSSKILVSAYFDQYRFPAPRFGTHQPTQGVDWLGLVEVQLHDDLQLYLQGRGEYEEDEYEVQGPYGRSLRKLDRSRRSSFRLHAEYRVNPRVRLRMRGEWVRSKPPGAPAEQGYLVYQDLRYQPNSRWTFDARVSVFETDSYNSRVYQFENDLLYLFSNTMLYDQGQRLYLLANYEPYEFMEIWAKFGITVFENRQVLGSGLSEIRGNTRSNLGVQVRFVF